MFAPTRTRVAGLGVAAAALVAGAVWALAPTNDDQRTLPPTTTSRPSAPPTTIPDSAPPSTGGSTTATTAATDTVPGSTTESAPTTPGMILDPVPAGYTLSYQWSPVDGSFPGYWFHLWATSDAAHTAGRWLSVGVGVSESYPPLTPELDAAGRPIPRVAAKYSADPDGVLRAAIVVSTGQGVSFAAFGFDSGELASIVDDTSVDGHNRPQFGGSAAALLDGTELVVGRATNVGAATSFYSAFGANQYDDDHTLSLESGPQRTNDLRADMLLNPSSVTAVDGHDAIAGTIAGSAGPTQFVEWHIGPDTVRLSGTLDLDSLLALAAAVRPATAEEWTPQP